MKSQFEDAFARYLSAAAPICVTTLQADTDNASSVTDVLPVTDTKVTGNNVVTQIPHKT